MFDRENEGNIRLESVLPVMHKQYEQVLKERNFLLNQVTVLQKETMCLRNRWKETLIKTEKNSNNGGKFV